MSKLKCKWILLVLLFIVVPIGLLAAFRLTVVIPEPPEPETITVETVSWEIDRPKIDVNLDDRVENAYTNDEASVGIGVAVEEYQENENYPPYDGNDGVVIRFWVNATVVQGFTSSVAVKLYPLDSEAAMFISKTFLVNQNATVTGIDQYGIKDNEAYILATATDSPCYISTTAHWVFYDQNVEDHQLNVTLEFTYQNLSMCKKVVLPILLSMVDDVSDNFEFAKQVAAGTCKGCLDNVDSADMYAVNVQENQTLTIMLKPAEDANFDLYLYNPNKAEVANSTLRGDATETITCTANSTGWWYVKAATAPSYNDFCLRRGLYQLEVMVSTP